MKEDILNLLKNNMMIFVNPKNKITKDRRNVVEKTYEKFGIKINYIEGPSIKECKKMNINHKKLIISRGKGVVGLLGSYINCVKKAKEKNMETVLIFEDDAIPINNDTFLRDFEESINKLPKDWKNEPYLLDFGQTRLYHTICIPLLNELFQKDNMWVSREKYAMASHATLLTRPAMDLFLKQVEKEQIEQPLDWYLNNIKGVKSLAYSGKISNNFYFRGIFEQHDTYCTTRSSIINSTGKNYVYWRNNKIIQFIIILILLSLFGIGLRKLYKRYKRLKT